MNIQGQITAYDLYWGTPRNPYRHKWAITMEPMENSKAPDNPYSGIFGVDGLIPATQFSLESCKVVTDTLDLCPGFDITLPIGYAFSRSLTITFYNEIYNGKDLLRTYLREYRKRVMPSYKTVIPYKQSCTKYCIYIMTPEYKNIDVYEYYGIPDLSDLPLSNDSETERYVNLGITLLGESSENPKH